MAEDLGEFYRDCDPGIEGSFEIPKGYTSLCHGAFFENDELEEIVFPSTLQKIRDVAFMDCTALKEIILPDSITDLETDAFCGCESVKKLKISNNLTIIRRGVFAGLGAKEIVIPDSVTSISDFIPNEGDESDDGDSWGGSGSFSGCAVQKLTLSKNLKLIGRDAFADCENLTEVVIPDSVTKIDKSAFKNCKSLKKVILSKNLEEIGDEAFMGCSALKELSIPDSVKVLGKQVFDKCPSLKLNKEYYERFMIAEARELAQTNPFTALQILYTAAMAGYYPAINELCTMLRTNDKIPNPNWPLNDDKFLTKVAELYKKGDTGPYEDVLFMYREHPKTKNPDREQEFLSKYINK